MEYTEVYLDSSQSIAAVGNYANTDNALFYFDYPIQNISYMKVIEAEIPVSYYTITSSNNTFTMTDGGGGSATVTLTPGNYNSSTLSTTLAAALTAASPTGKTYTVTFSSTTQKFTITVSSTTFTLTFGTTGDDGQTNPRFFLGMNAGANSSTLTSLVSPNTANITGPNYLYICSDVLGGLVNSVLPNLSQNRGQKGPQIARVPVNVNPGEVVYYNDPVPEKWFPLPNLLQIRQLDLYLTLGTSSEKIQLNGQPFSIKLGLLLNRNAGVDVNFPMAR